ncbi:MAG: T9SS type A sorting domain-containing protein [Ignavibacterium sp.]|nr:T9SS type A sorting domain-containing protein [Ignavibacterium sp.]
MTMPGGTVVEALRIKEDRITIPGPGSFSIYDRHFSYIFVTKTGEQVTILADTTQPTTGIINNYGAVSWKNTWITSADDENTLPNKFTLAQNYPNPFNPSTKISWQSPIGSWHTLKVYDVLGNEVVTLVNEYRDAGNYETEFNADKLSSGVYFYKLQAGSFVVTKKMMLLK